MLSMFSKKQGADIKKIITKLNDPKKDLLTKIKYLKTIIDTQEPYDIKSIFEENNLIIYHTFYDYFCEIGKPKNFKLYKEELEIVLNIFEVILYTLPELINKRWQYNSIWFAILKICHHCNNLKVREYGVKLFITWYQILLPNYESGTSPTYKVEITTASLDRLLVTIIPGLNGNIVLDMIKYQETLMPNSSNNLCLNTFNYFPSYQMQNAPNLGIIGGKLMANSQVSRDTIPIYLTPENPSSFFQIPSEESISGQKIDSVGCHLLEILLEASVWQGNKIMWANESSRNRSYTLLFEKINTLLVPLIFPKIQDVQSYHIDLYSPTFNPMNVLTSPPDTDTDRHVASPLLPYQKSFLTWLLRYVRHPDVSWPRDDIQPHSVPDGISNSATQPQVKSSTTLPNLAPDQQPGDGGSSTVSSTSTTTKSVGASPPPSTEIGAVAGSLANAHGQPVKGSRGDSYKVTGSHKLEAVHRNKSLHFANESFSTDSGGSGSIDEASKFSPLIQGRTRNGPTDPCNRIYTLLIGTCRTNVNLVLELMRLALRVPHSCFDIKEEIIQLFRSWILESEYRPIFMQEEPDTFGYARSAPDTPPSLPDPPSANERDHVMTTCQGPHLEAGFQRCVRTLLCLAGQVFLTNPLPPSIAGAHASISSSTKIDDEYEICKRVLNLFRQVVMATPLNEYSWKAVISTLVRIIKIVKVGDGIDVGKNKSILQYGSNRLLGAFIQTLLVTFIKASLNILIPVDTWTDLSQTLKSLVHHEELFIEWSKTMDTLLRIYARQVFDLDLSDLPSDRLTEQKSKKRRGQQQQQASQQPTRGISGPLTPAASLAQQRSALPPPPGRPLSTPLPVPYRQPSNVGGKDSFGGNTAASCDDQRDRGRHALERTTSGTAIPSSDISSGRAGELYVVNSHESNDAASVMEASTPSQLFGLDDRQTIKRLPARSDQQAVDRNLMAAIQDSPPLKLPSIKSFNSLVSDNSRPSEEEFFATSDRSGPMVDDGECADEEYHGAPSPKNGMEGNLMDFYGDDVDGLPRGENVNDITLTNSISSKQEISMSIDQSKTIPVHTGGGGDGYIPPHGSCGVSNNQSRRHVMMGGTVTGWSAESADILWRRMLGILGNLNDLDDVYLKCRFTNYLSTLFDNFTKIRDNQYLVAQENQVINPPVSVPRGSRDDVVDGSSAHCDITSGSLSITPPMDHLIPWLLQACSQHVETFVNSHGGSFTNEAAPSISYVSATVSLLTKMTFRRHESCPTYDYLRKFYYLVLTMVSPRTDNQMDDSDNTKGDPKGQYSLLTTTSLLNQSSRDIFSHYLPGCTLLLRPLVTAAKRVILQTRSGGAAPKNFGRNITNTDVTEAIIFLSRVIVFSLPFVQHDVIQAGVCNGTEGIVRHGPFPSLQVGLVSDILSIGKTVSLDVESTIQVMRSLTLFIFHNNRRSQSCPTRQDEGSAHALQRYGTLVNECVSYLLLKLRGDDTEICHFAIQCLRSLASLDLDTYSTASPNATIGTSFGTLIVKELCQNLKERFEIVRTLKRPLRQSCSVINDLQFCITEWVLSPPSEDTTTSESLSRASAATDLLNLVRETLGQISVLANPSPHPQGAGGNPAKSGRPPNASHKEPFTNTTATPSPPNRLSRLISDATAFRSNTDRGEKLINGEASASIDRDGSDATGVQLTRTLSGSVVDIARFLTRYVTYHASHYPLYPDGYSRMDCIGTESSLMNLSASETAQSPHIQFFTLDNSCLLSFCQIPDSDCPKVTSEAIERPPILYIVVRDRCGKFVWKMNPAPPCATNRSRQDPVQWDTALRSGGDSKSDSSLGAGASPLLPTANASTTDRQGGHFASPESVSFNPPLDSPLYKSSPKQSPGRTRKTSPSPVKDYQTIDPLETVLRVLYQTDPDLFTNLPCVAMFEDRGGALPLPDNPALNHPLYRSFQTQVGRDQNLVFNQQHDGQTSRPFLPIECPKHKDLKIPTAYDPTANPAVPEDLATSTKPPINCPDATTSRRSCPMSYLHACRQFLHQMDFFSRPNRNRLNLVTKNGQFWRQLKHLDSLVCRETHKIAVIYVGRGQEDKTAILSNTRGSLAYERFLAGLGTQIDITNHKGFSGGLSALPTNNQETKDQTTDLKAVYYSTALSEIIFHVATWMNYGPAENTVHYKLKHIGNDEIHVVWCDHMRDYRKSTIATEFCDVLIVIYPIPEYDLFRISIIQTATNLGPGGSPHKEYSNFGPLFDGALVDECCLAPLIRETVLNASRIKKCHTQSFQHNYDTRDKCLSSVLAQHTLPSTFEDMVFSTFFSQKDPNQLIKQAVDPVRS